MTFFEIFIIYLTFGAPVAVYHVFEHRAAAAPRWPYAVAAFLLWPLEAARLTIRRISDRASSTEFVPTTVSDAALVTLAADIASAIRRTGSIGHSPEELFRMKDVLYRYVEISAHAAAKAGSGPDHSDALFTAAGRGPDKVGGACLKRRNASHLAAHQTEARNDFMSLVAVAGAPTADRPVPIQKGMLLAELLGDHEAVKEMRSVADELRLAAERSQRESWKPQPQHIPGELSAVTLSMLTSTAPSKSD